MLETLDYTIRIGSTPTILYFDKYNHVYGNYFEKYRSRKVCLNLEDCLTDLQLLIKQSFLLFFPNESD